MFASARRAQRFLEFVVEQTLAARQDYIKESVIGSEVFGREAGYDPRADGIVRVNATKLRSRLSDYYANAGKADVVLIEIPKGSYVPRVSLRESGAKPSLSLTRFKTQAVVGAALAVLPIFAIAATLRNRYPDVASTTTAVPKSIAVAVLPFLNLSSDPENEYFSDGLTEQLTDILTQVEGLRVASRTSAFTFNGKSADAVEIGSKLRVDAIVEGSVRRSGDELCITAQLIQTSDGYHRWSKTFERSLKDVFELEEEISRQIAQELRVTFAQDSKRRYFSRYIKEAKLSTCTCSGVIY
jgi:serine/threonine-protein kinase